MKTKVLFSVLLALFLIVLQNPVSAQTGNEGSVSAEAENEQPEFPGGVIEMLKYIKTNTKYPSTAVEAKKNGKCHVKFLVTETGSINDVTILDGISSCPECNEEALRVVRSMPKWKPGKIAGKAVALYYNVTVSFKPPKK